MDLYKKRNYWKRFLLTVGMLIVIFSVIYIRELVREIALQEREKAGVIAEAYKTLNTTSNSDSLNTVVKIISDNKLIPIICTNGDLESAFTPQSRTAPALAMVLPPSAVPGVGGALLGG